MFDNRLHPSRNLAAMSEIIEGTGWNDSLSTMSSEMEFILQEVIERYDFGV